MRFLHAMSWLLVFESCGGSTSSPVEPDPKGTDCRTSDVPKDCRDPDGGIGGHQGTYLEGTDLEGLHFKGAFPPKAGTRIPALSACGTATTLELEVVSCDHAYRRAAECTVNVTHGDGICRVRDDRGNLLLLFAHVKDPQGVLVFSRERTIATRPDFDHRPASLDGLHGNRRIPSERSKPGDVPHDLRRLVTPIAPASNASRATCFVPGWSRPHHTSVVPSRVRACNGPTLP